MHMKLSSDTNNILIVYININVYKNMGWYKLFVSWVFPFPNTAKVFRQFPCCGHVWEIIRSWFFTCGLTSALRSKEHKAHLWRPLLSESVFTAAEHYSLHPLNVKTLQIYFVKSGLFYKIFLFNLLRYSS